MNRLHSQVDSIKKHARFLCFKDLSFNPFKPTNNSLLQYSRNEHLHRLVCKYKVDLKRDLWLGKTTTTFACPLLFSLGRSFTTTFEISVLGSFTTPFSCFPPWIPIEHTCTIGTLFLMTISQDYAAAGQIWAFATFMNKSSNLFSPLANGLAFLLRIVIIV